MSITNFIYRQKQKIKYHLSKDLISRKINEINRYEKQVDFEAGRFRIRELDLELPFFEYQFIFTKHNYALLIKIAKILNGQYYFNGDLLTFEFDSYKIGIYSSSEIFIINEIFVDKCYNHIFYDDSIVIDLGMNVGISSLFFAGQSKVLKVFAFEPFKQTFKRGLINFQLNPVISSKIEPSNYALGKENKTVRVKFNQANTGVNSISLDNERFELQYKQLLDENIEIKRTNEVLSKVLKANKNYNIVLKVDTEGSEYDIFSSLEEQGLFKYVNVVMVEWHYRGSDNLHGILKKNQFNTFELPIGLESGLIYGVRS